MTGDLRTWWPRAISAIPAGVIMLTAVIELITPHQATAAPLLLTAPVAAASLLRPRGIVLTGICAMLVHAALAYVHGRFGPHAGISNQVALAAVTALALLINRGMQIQHRRVRRAQYVSALAQKAVLPTPPARLQGLDIATRYVPAEAEALIGGDLYAVQETPFGLRLFIGDVRGKGLSAVESVSVDLGAFRHAADHAPDLLSLARQLEASIDREAGRRVSLDDEEGFTTALLAEVPRGQRTVRILNRGHPAPLMLTEAGGQLLTPSVHTPPLGLASAFGGWDAPVDDFPFPEGATLLCFTDGITEARDATGAFYEPQFRLPALLKADRAPSPLAAEHVLETLTDDVLRHTKGAITDDQALLALHRPRGDAE